MPYPDSFFRRANFSQDLDLGLDLSAPKLDTELNGLATTVAGILLFLKRGFNVDGTLRNVAVATAQALVGSERFAATAAQTVFTTTIVWESSFTALNVEVFINGVKLDPNRIAAANNGGFLELTLTPATPLVLNDVVVVNAFESGAGLLTRLTSTANSDGASLVAIEDAGGLYISATVEDALQEIGAALNAYIAAVGSLSNLIHADGSVPFTANQSLGGHKLTNLAAATANGEAVRFNELQAVIDDLDAVASTFLAKAGGTMSGDIDLNGNTISNVPAPTADDQVVPKSYVDDALASFTGFPIGAIIDYAGSAAPSGWHLCDGAAVARTGTFAGLFAVIGVVYGVGDGVSTFNLPDTRSRFRVTAGTGSGLTTRAVAATGGEEEHVLTIAELPAHGHSFTLKAGTGVGNGGGFQSSTGDSGLTGGDTGHNTMPPFIALNTIIKY